MKEGLNLDGIKYALKLKFERVKPFVKSEHERLSGGAKAPCVSVECPEKLKPLAERLVEIQALNGEIKTEDIEKNDIYRIKDMSREPYKLSFRDAISFMVENAYYVDYDVVNARHILRFLREFEEIYNKYYEQNGAVPLNAFSNETRLFIKNLKSGISKEEVMRTILEVYAPEFADVKMEHHNYELVPKSPLSKEEINRIVAELSSIANDNNIDSLFSKKYEPYFKKLCERLKMSGYTFHSFITKHSNFDYTMCFKCDIVKATRQMIISYFDKNGTTVGIQYKDPYLYNKIELAKEILGVYTISEVLDLMGIEGDNYDTSKKTLSPEEIAQREKVLFAKLEQIYPDKFITLKSSINESELYEELLFLARRRKFANINDYLATKGFSRDLNYNAKVNRNMYLSERDIVHYDFIKKCKTAEEVEKQLAENGVTLADPYVSLGVYRKLAFEGIDSEVKIEKKSAVNKNMFSSLS